jgi:hypothetical protein
MMVDDDGTREVPDGAAVFPAIPEELGTDPLLLAVIHATVFLAGSDDRLVDPAAADEVVEAMGNYLRRLEGDRLAAIREDMECLVSYARQQQWTDELIESLRNLLADYGIEERK